LGQQNCCHDKENEYGKLENLGVGKSKSLGVARGCKQYKPFNQSIQQMIGEAENNFI
jgi:cell division protein FtsA